MNLAIKLTFLTLACIGLSIAGVPLKARPTKQKADIKLMNFMVETQSISKQNPQRSIECFNYYVPVLNNITLQYELDFYNCVFEADTAKDKLNIETADEVTPFSIAVQNVCGELYTCNSVDTTMAALRCFESNASRATKIMYDISANATDVAGDIEQQIYMIELGQERCTNTTERAYVQNTAETYDELQRCIAGEIPVPEIAARH